MSIDATRWAWQQKVTATEKIVLLSLADRSGESNECWPSIARLEADTGLNRKTLFSVLKRLESKGYISVENRGRNSNIYTLIGVERRHEVDKKHYVYCVTHVETNEFYIGVKSTDEDPAKDRYYGSGKWSRSQDKRLLKREIIGIYQDRDDAEFAEASLIIEHINNPLCRNLHTEVHRLSIKNGTTNHGSTKNGTTKNHDFVVPKTVPGSTDFGTGASTKIGTLNLSIEPTKNQKKEITNVISQKTSEKRNGERLGLESLPEAWRQFCHDERPGLDADRVFARFRDYWIAQPGAKGRKLDWFATWRNWVRNENGVSNGAHQPSGQQRKLSAVELVQQASRRYEDAERRRGEKIVGPCD